MNGPKAALTVIPLPGVGAEDVVVDARGDVWTGTEDGAIFRVRPDGGRIDRVAGTGGRPLGLELYGDRILVADAHRGLLAVDDQGRLESLVDSVAGRPMVFCNNAAVAANGDIWFSDSSTVHPIERWKNDFVENTCTGRLLCRRADGSVEVHLDGLAFANGVALAADESWVAVAETGRRTVVRLWLSGEHAGQRDYLVEDLVGYPDNIALGSDGLVWVTIASPRDPLVERLQRAPLPVRRAVTRIPEALQPRPKQTARVQAFDGGPFGTAGRLVHDVDADASRYHMVTGVREHEGRVWMGSLVEPAVAFADL
jgi:sugar lactone lactonase YvrE